MRCCLEFCYRNLFYIKLTLLIKELVHIDFFSKKLQGRLGGHYEAAFELINEIGAQKRRS